MLLSIVIPLLNEIKYIDSLIESLLIDMDINKEIIFVDGGSTDGTLERIYALQKANSSLKLINNPARFASHGFNTAFKQATGKFIAFIGAHAVYPPNYFSSAIKYLESGECDVVGGPLKQEGKTTMGKAIAACMSSRFGVGGTEFRTSTKKQYVRSVAFAVYRREVFEKAGMLDEELLRNQDDELHYRLRKFGYKILMVPEMQCTYFVRDSIGKLISQYFQYGLYKPLVFKKAKAGFRLWHFIPAMFVLYLTLIPLAFYFPFYLLPLTVYFAADIIFSFKGRSTVPIKLYSLLVFSALHISYGAGFILGLRKLI